MKDSEVYALENGLYEITWAEGGGHSLAAVGRNQAGLVWFSATNWSSGPSCDWNSVVSIRLLMPEKNRGKNLVIQPRAYDSAYYKSQQSKHVDPAVAQIAAAILGGMAANPLVVQDWEGITGKMIQQAVFSAEKAIKEIKA